MIERPTARYGRQRLNPRRRRLIAVALTALVLIAGVAIAVVAFNRLGAQEVDGEINGFRVVDDATVEVTMNVTRKDPSRPAVCIVRARSYDGDEVGRREVLVSPSQEPTVQVTATVTASKPPAVGDVYGCGTDVPAYLDQAG
ncbi:DUF4307 domain-containing protein [Mycobacterium sp. SMC-4]|uniref:DUF4307 domain-containing protein n=1 Tax=Mycobacterium sp. SMC-4 TaxID=2857059 RepID=UPI003CFE299F